MPAVVGEIQRHGVSKVIQEEVTGNQMSALITSIQAVKEAMNDLLSAIVEEEAGPSITHKAQDENAPPEDEEQEEEESSDEPAESDKDSNKKRQKL